MCNRALWALVCAAVAILGTASAQAEKRIFIIANNAEGYGIDRCLATGAACGTAVAAAYCRSHSFADAVSFRKVEGPEITTAVAVNSNACRLGVCNELIAIECQR